MTAIDVLLDLLDRAYGKRAWHGTTLRGSLRGLKVDMALWRPAPERHNIWELLLHAAYWKYIARRHVAGDDSLRFPRKPSNWPDPPDQPSAKDLKADIALLQEQHDGLRAAVAAFPASKLGHAAGKGVETHAMLIHGVAAHDLYHTGQIQLLKRLYKG